jgi:hypothetical protein
MTRLVTAAALAAVRLLLFLHPSAFRRAFAREILDDVRRDIAEGAGRGAVHAGAAGVRAILDAASALKDRRPRRQRRVPSFWTDDLRIASRYARAGGTTTAVIGGTLALAIAAAVAIFAVAEAAWLRPLPYPDGDRLVRVEERTDRGGRAGVSVPAFDAWVRELPSLAAAAFYEPRDATVVIRGEADRLAGATVSRELFDVLGVRPAIGRTFTPAPRFGPPAKS